MTLRNVARDTLRALLAPTAVRLGTARLLRPLLRASAGAARHHRWWTWTQLVVNRPNTRALASTWFGARVECDLADMIAQRIFYTGVWEPDINALIARHLAPGDTFIDIGANVGYFSLLAARAVGPGGHVYAIEPWPDTVRQMRRNVQLNRLANVAIVDRAVAVQRGSLTLHGGGEGNSGEVSAIAPAGQRQQHAVQAAPLRELLSPQALSQASVIKIDIEGGEPPVLRELFGVAEQLSPRLLIVAEVTPPALAQYGWPLAQLVDDFAARDFAAQRVHNDYRFGTDWWRFDPKTAPRLSPVDVHAQDRFDLVLSRTP